jgi:hypothetical protein
MADEKKKERKIIKIGTHGRTNANTFNRGPLPYAQGSDEKPKETLQAKDKQEWKARKAKRQLRKDRARSAAKKAGVKIGRWQGSVAYAKDGSKRCITVGSPEIANGYEVVQGGDQ